MTTLDKTIDLIQKLQRLAESPGATEAEATLAMERMQKLLFDHNLTLDQVRIAAGDEKKVEEDLQTTRDYFSQNSQMVDREWKCRLADGLCQYNFCAMLYGSAASRRFSHITFVGSKVNVDAVHEIFYFAMHQIEDLAEESFIDYKHEGGLESRRHYIPAFRIGCVERVHDRLRDAWYALQRANESSTALVIRNDAALKAKVRAISGKGHVRLTSAGGDGKAAGYDAGNLVNLARPQRLIRA